MKASTKQIYLADDGREFPHTRDGQMDALKHERSILMRNLAHKLGSISAQNATNAFMEVLIDVSWYRLSDIDAMIALLLKQREIAQMVKPE